MTRLWIAAGLGLALSACGGGSSDGDPAGGGGLAGSCIESPAICHEHRGIDQFQLQQLQTSCASTGGTFSTASCPDAGRSGRCVAAAGSLQVIYAYYGLGASEVQVVKSSCISAGNSWLDG
ncbi:MAG: hypothetical protein QM704_07280 [Anaeromyxobacteraceae bacterium]